MTRPPRHILLAGLLLALAATPRAGSAEPKADPHAAHRIQAEAAEPAAAEGEAKSCCHKAKGADDAALPAGLTELGDEAPQGAGLPPPVEVTLAAASLKDQTGASVQFPAGVLGDRLVVMDFIFTTCTTICPVLSAKLARVQERLGARAGPEVTLVSISIDPARDTPARLAEFGARFKSGPAWRWLTGNPDDVTRVLKGLGAWSPRFAEHGPIVLVGDARTGRWHRFNGFPEVDRVVAAVDALAAARGTTAAAPTSTAAARP